MRRIFVLIRFMRKYLHITERKKMGTLYFLRHGETVWNSENRICGTTDIELTPLGHEQAIQAGKDILSSGIRFDEIISSPLKRARDTAGHIAEITGKPVRIDGRLTEQNFGKYEATSRFGPEYLASKEHFADRNESGESLLQLAQRVYNLLDEIRRDPEGKTFLLVAHNGVARSVESYFTSQQNREYACFGLKNCEIRSYIFDEKDSKERPHAGAERPAAEAAFSEASVREKYNRLTRKLIEKGKTITFMESCTAGQLSSLVTDTEGSSAVLKGAFVTYSNEAKIRQGVPGEVIEKYGVYSPETAGEMAKACRAAYGADIGVGITGSFGNVDPANEDSEPGEVYYAIETDRGLISGHSTVPLQPSRLAYKLYMADILADRIMEII